MASRYRHAIAAATAFVCAFALCWVPSAVPDAAADTAPVEPGLPATVSATVQPAPQIDDDGVVWDVAISGGVAFVGGQFTSARAAGVREAGPSVPRGNLLAFTLATGELLDFAPIINGTVRSLAVSPAGNTLYVAGNFTEVDGQKRTRVAAFDIATGQLTAFAPYVDATVLTVLPTAGYVYLGGIFSKVENDGRENLARLRVDDVESPTTATVDSWNPRATGRVRGIQVSPDGGSVVVGGDFDTLAGVTAGGWGRVSASTGAALSWPVNDVINPSGDGAAIYSLKAGPRGLYATSYSFAGWSPFEGVVHVTWEGEISWIKGCKGDTYDTAIMDDVVYSVGHTHNCEPIGGIPQTDPWIYQRAEALTAGPSPSGRTNQGLEYDGYPAPELLHWYPELEAGSTTGLNQAAWTAEAADGYLVLGGEFRWVNNTRSVGIAVFTKPANGASTSAPRPLPDDAVLTGVVSGPGQVRVTVPKTYDRDNAALTYTLMRNGEPASGTVVYRQRWWESGDVEIIDPFAPNGDHVYTVVIRDPEGNEYTTAEILVTVDNAPDPGDITALLLADGATGIWRFEESSGNVAYNVAGSGDMLVGPSLKWGEPGALSGETNTAARFAGSDYVPAATTDPIYAPAEYTVEAWFNSTSADGGAIVNFGSSRVGTSRLRDRMVYLQPDGRVSFGTRSASGITAVTSPGTYNDGAWHHVAATYAVGTMALYVDGLPAGTATGVATPERFAGYYKVGGDGLVGFPGEVRDWAYEGLLDEVAVYREALDPVQIALHFRVARAGAPGTPDTTTPDTTEPETTPDTTEPDAQAPVAGAKEAQVVQSGPLAAAASPGVSEEFALSTRTAHDTFDRTISPGLGRATSGHDWRTAPVSLFGADKEAGVVALTRGMQAMATMPDIATLQARVEAELTLPDRDLAHFEAYLVPRQVGTEQYRARLRFDAAGAAHLDLVRAGGSQVTVLDTMRLEPAPQPGARVLWQAEARGAWPTNLSTALVPAGETLESAPQLQRAVKWQSLGQAGEAGFGAALYNGATGPVYLRVNEFRVSELAQ